MAHVQITGGGFGKPWSVIVDGVDIAGMLAVEGFSLTLGENSEPVIQARLKTGLGAVELDLPDAIVRIEAVD